MFYNVVTKQRNTSWCTAFAATKYCYTAPIALQHALSVQYSHAPSHVLYLLFMVLVQGTSAREVESMPDPTTSTTAASTATANSSSSGVVAEPPLKITSYRGSATQCEVSLHSLYFWLSKHTYIPRCCLEIAQSCEHVLVRCSSARLQHNTAVAFC
jgi:hypothetical protein